MNICPAVILGVDPGFSVTGYAILKKEGGKALLLDYGYLKMSSQKSLVERVGIFYNMFHEKIAQHQVTEIALETSFLGKNAQTFLKLGYLRGVLYLLAAQGGLVVNEFAPREVKCTVTGYGAASKDQVATMVLRLFPRLAELGTIERQDVTDAMAVCLCGFWQSKRIQAERL
jgi:crossover junction endodeoxyribonuclease RuvC